jgi:hypothetical protein
MKCVILPALLASIALSVDITFDSAKEYTGQSLYGSKELSDMQCYDLSTNEKVRSAVLANLGEGEVLSFFCDGVCRKMLDSVSSASCYSPERSIGSFQVNSPP